MATGLRLPDPELPARVSCFGNRPGVECPDLACDLLGGHRPVDHRLGFFEFVSITCLAFILHPRLQHSTGETVQIFLQQLRAHDRQAVMQPSPGIIGFDRACSRGKYRTGIQAGVHLHEADSRFPVTGQDGPLYGCGAAPARQERGMDIDTTQPRHRQHRGRQNQAIGDHDHQVGPESIECRLGITVPERSGLADGYGKPACQPFHRAFRQTLSTPTGSIGTGINRRHLMGTIQQHLQDG